MKLCKFLYFFKNIKPSVKTEFIKLFNDRLMFRLVG